MKRIPSTRTRAAASVCVLLISGLSACTADDTVAQIHCGSGTVLSGQDCLATASSASGSSGSGGAVSCGSGTVLVGQVCMVMSSGDATTSADADDGDAIDATIGDAKQDGAAPDAADADAFSDAADATIGDATQDGAASDVADADAFSDAADAANATIGDATQDGAASDAADAGVSSDAADAGSVVDAADAMSTDAVVTADGAEGPDDPCPTGISRQQIARNCSTTCAVQSDCSDIACQSWVTLPVLGGSSFNPSLNIVRTPSHPGMNANCSVCATPTAYSFEIVSAYYSQPPPPPSSPPLKVTVSPPWSLLAGSAPEGPFCFDPASATQCAVIRQTLGRFADPISLTVVTNDPNAPARNVTIEAVADDSGAVCP